MLTLFLSDGLRELRKQMYYHDSVLAHGHPSHARARSAGVERTPARICLCQHMRLRVRRTCTYTHTRTNAHTWSDFERGEIIQATLRFYPTCLRLNRFGSRNAENSNQARALDPGQPTSAENGLDLPEGYVVTNHPLWEVDPIFGVFLLCLGLPRSSACYAPK